MAGITRKNEDRETGMRTSIMQAEKRCFICGAVKDLERHHVMDGPNRRHSETYGLTVWLCRNHHTGDHGAHNNRKLDLFLREEAQAAFERTHSRADWMRVFGRNYL